MELKRTLIPPELRPFVAGSDIRRNDEIGPKIIRDNLFLACDLIVVGSIEDGTLKYFMERSSSICRVTFIPLEEPLLVVALIDEILESTRKTGIYFRACGSLNIDVNQSQQILSDCLQNYQGKVVHRSVDMSRNFSKPWQLTTIPGDNKNIVRVPQTRIGTSQSKDKFLYPQIGKSISSVRSTVAKMDDRFPAHGFGMTQQFLTGQNIRVHCFQGNVFSWEIQSNNVDYRVDPGTELKEFALPENIQAWCINATKREELDFSGIDLIRVEDKWFCFEINPTPGYHYYESRLIPYGSYPLTNAIISWFLSD